MVTAASFDVEQTATLIPLARASSTSRWTPGLNGAAPIMMMMMMMMMMNGNDSDDNDDDDDTWRD